jgi:hypothetical protein
MVLCLCLPRKAVVRVERQCAADVVQGLDCRDDLRRNGSDVPGVFQRSRRAHTILADLNIYLAHVSAFFESTCNFVEVRLNSV